MQNLYTTFIGSRVDEADLTAREKFSVNYHNLFDYPLNFSEIIRWLPHVSFCNYGKQMIRFAHKNGFYYLKGREGLIYKRILRKRISAKKLEIAKSASKILSFLPGIKMVGVTGSLAMSNSTEDSDIDLMIITKAGNLWTTRLLTYFVLSTTHFVMRRPFDRNQKDKLCLNMWFDENDLVWQKKDRNIYTAHEIGQILLLVNRNKTYEKFLRCNRWILGFWPNSVKIVQLENKMENGKSENGKYTSGLLEKLCYRLQYQHMKSKITREVVTPTRALFHPHDWGKVVLSRLNRNNGIL